MEVNISYLPEEQIVVVKTHGDADAKSSSEIKSEWLSLSPDYVQKISTTTPPPAALTDAEKLARLWAAHPELH